MKKLLLLLMFFPLLTSTVVAQSGCPNNIASNGNLSQGTAASGGDQNINAAADFSSIWSTGSFAEFFVPSYAPPGATPPSPATGNYVSCWIANFNGSGVGYREGFKSELASPIPSNSGIYDLSFDLACLNSRGWGTPEVAVYGIYNPSGAPGASPTDDFTPSNMDLYGAPNTILLGTVLINNTCSHIKTNHTISFDASAAGFPINGITHFFVTHSDNQSISGARYMAFDNFCIQDITPPCPNILQANLECERNASYLFTGNHIFSIYVQNPGSMSFSVPCGTISPAVISGAGVHTFTITGAESCSTPFAIEYQAADNLGNLCAVDTLQLNLPNCQPPCPEITTQSISCEQNAANELTGNYVIDLSVSNAGTMNLSVPCGTVSPSTIIGAGTHQITITGTGACSTPFLLEYQALNYLGICDTDTLSFNLPNCQPPCPSVSDRTIICEEDASNNLTGNHIVTVAISNAGTTNFSTTCGTVSPSTITSPGIYDLTITSTCTNPFVLEYQSVDYNGNTCTNDTLELILPNCQPLGFCPNGFTSNGDLSQGTAASGGDQHIDNAVDFSRIWSNGSFAEFYVENYAPSGYTPPSPATGNYASCWIANYAGGGTGYREGFKSQLVTPIAPNSGAYDISLDLAVLNGWGTPEVAIYGVYNPSGNPSPNPTGAYTPSNLDLYGATNTVLLGTIAIDNSFSNSKQNYTLSFITSGIDFPANGMTHFFVTHSDNQSISGAKYMAFDNFCIQPGAPVITCPQVHNVLVDCEQTGSNTSTGNHTITLTTTHAGTVNFSTSCGNISPTSISSPGTHTLTLSGTATCSNNMMLISTYVDVTGTICNSAQFNLNLPYCEILCPEIIDTDATCIDDVDGDGIQDYEVQLLVNNSGSFNLSTSCGTVYPSSFSNINSGIYTVTIISNGTCTPFSLEYQSIDTDGNFCSSNNVAIQLPRCFVPICPCGESLIANVELGFLQLQSCPNDVFAPNSLSSCDEVTWSVNGNIVAHTQGNDPFITPHLYGLHQVCMIVQRTQPNGEICQHRKCVLVRSPIRCPGGPGGGGIGLGRLNVSPNPATDIIDVTWNTEAVPDKLSIQIFNTNGIEVQRLEQINGHEGKAQFNVQKLVSGLYIIKVQGQDYSPNPIKFIKTN